MTVPIANARGIALDRSTDDLVLVGTWYGNSDLALLRGKPWLADRDFAELMAEARAIESADSSRIDEAIAMLDAAHRQGGDQSINAALLQGRFLNYGGRYSEVESLVSPFLTADDPNRAAMAEVVMWRARVELDSNPAEAAVRLPALAAQLHAAGIFPAANGARFALARHYYRSERFTQAIEATDEIRAEASNASPTQRARALLLRADVYTQLGLENQSIDSLIGMFGLGIQDPTLLDNAADRVIHIALAEDPKSDAAVLALRALASRAVDAPWLAARLRTAEGRILRERGSLPAAEEAFFLGAAFASQAPLPAAEAAGELAATRVERGDFAGAITGLRIASESIDVDSPLLARTRNEVAQYYLRKGRRELLLRDPMLALRTFEELLSVEPQHIEGWRGKIAALSTREDLLDQAIRTYRQETRQSRRDSLAWYKYGLALSYRDPESSRALASVRRAIELQPTVPFHYLTEGYLLEQQFRRSERTGTPDYRPLEVGLEAYARAMAMLDPAANPQLEADLLLNSANASLLLRQSFRAAELYKRRGELPVDFADIRTELLFHWNYGIAAFRASLPSESVTQFGRALEKLDQVRLAGLLENDRISEIRRELRARRALGWMDSGLYAESAAEFLTLVELEPEGSMERARAWRNRALALERVSEQSEGAARREALRNAAEACEAALSILSNPRVRTSRSDDPSALLSLSMTLTSDTVGGGARLDFDKRDEERLLLATRARVAQHQHDSPTAARMLERQLALEPRIDDSNRAYEGAVRSVVLSRLSREAELNGDVDTAFRLAAEGLAISRFTIAGYTLIDANAATRHLVRLMELALRHGEPGRGIRDSFWMLAPTERQNPASIWDVYIAASTTLLAADDPASPGLPLLALDSYAARAELIQVFANERRAWQLIESANAEIGVRQLSLMGEAAAYIQRAEAGSAALELRANGALQPGDVPRLAALANGTRVRLAALRGDGSETEALAAARDFAFRTGQPTLDWWYHAQAALAAPPERRAPHALEALSLLESAVAFREDAAAPFAFELLDYLESVTLADPAVVDHAAASWHLVERWRNARLAVLARGMEFNETMAGEGRWLQDLARLQSDYGDAVARRRRAFLLRREPGSLVEQRADGIRQHLATGREAGFPSARSLAPVAIDVETMMAFFAPPQPFDPPASLLLHRRVGEFDLSFVYTGREFRPVSSWDDLAGGPVFVLGDHPPLDPARVVSILNSESFLQLQELATFDYGDERIVYTGRNSRTDLLLARKLELTNPVQPRGTDVADWMLPLPGGPVMEEIRAAAPSVDSLVLSLDRPAPHNGPLMMANWLARQGLVNAEIDGQQWLNLFLEPHQAPIIAAEELNLAQNRLLTLLERSAAESSILELDRILFLMEALGHELIPRYSDSEALFDEEFALYAGQAAVLRARLRQPTAAIAAAERRLAIIERSQPQAYAEALKWSGDIASIAGNHTRAEEFYLEAERLYEEAGEEARALAVRRDRAINFESGGAFLDSWNLGSKVRAAIPDTDAQAAVRQDLRMARVARIYLNRYAEAGELLARAEDIAYGAGLEKELLDVYLNQTRVAHATGRFDEAMRLLDEAETIARSIQSEEKLAEVALERANVHWYRSDYFNAFGAQRTAIDGARAANSQPIQVAALNIAGLISWSVNDSQRAFDHLNEAWTLANEMAVPAEIATTANNMGLVHRSLAQFDDALDWFGRALAVDEREGNRWGIAYSKRNIAMTHLAAESPDAALPLLDGAIELASEIGDEVNLAKALLARADTLAELSRGTEARRDYTAALNLAASLPLPEVAWRCLYGEAQLEEDEGNLRRAVELLGQAIDIVDALRAAIRIEEFQDGFLLDKQDLYDTMITLQMNLGRDREALETSEKSRGRNFIDLLGNRSLSLKDEEDERQVAEEGRLRSRIEDLQRRIHNAEGTELARLTTEFDTARRDYADFMIALRADNPQLSGFVRVDPVNVEELQAMLDVDTRLLVYHILPTEIIIWTLGPASLDAVRVPVAAAQLARDIGSVRQGLQDFESVEARLSTLGSVLLDPVLPYVAGARRLGIVPHRELHSLPFAALPAGAAPTVLDRFALFYAPSASVLRYTMARRDATDRGRGVLAIGNPDLGHEGLSLPFAEKEAERLRFTFPDLVLRTGSEASETWAAEFLRDFAIIHIASHGEFNPGMPLFSGVMLAPDDKNDGVLSAEEVFGLDLRADLVALSACQSGLGQLSNGDDIVGLGRSFVYAGTRQLLTTLWRVDDVSTALMFKYFYRGAEDLDRAEALRRAQLQLRARPEYSHPSHWASVVLTGDWL